MDRPCSGQRRPTRPVEGRRDTCRPALENAWPAGAGASPHAGSFGNTGNSSPPSVHIDHDAGATAFSRHQSMDAAARQRGMDPLAFRLQQIKDPVVANGLTRAATAFGWTEKWRGWAHDDIERRRPGIGLALTNEGTADAEGSTIAVFVDVDVDTELGTISLVTAPCWSSRVRLPRPCSGSRLRPGLRWAWRPHSFRTPLPSMISTRLRPPGTSSHAA